MKVQKSFSSTDIQYYLIRQTIPEKLSWSKIFVCCLIVSLKYSLFLFIIFTILCTFFVRVLPYSSIWYGNFTKYRTLHRRIPILVVMYLVVVYHVWQQKIDVQTTCVPFKENYSRHRKFWSSSVRQGFGSHIFFIRLTSERIQEIWHPQGTVEVSESLFPIYFEPSLWITRKFGRVFSKGSKVNLRFLPNVSNSTIFLITSISFPSVSLSVSFTVSLVDFSSLLLLLFRKSLVSGQYTYKRTFV